MDASNVLESMLNDGRNMVAVAQDKAEAHFDIPEAGPERDAMVDGMQKGAMAAGALALLLGTKSGRRLGGARRPAVSHRLNLLMPRHRCISLTESPCSSEVWFCCAP